MCTDSTCLAWRLSNSPPANPSWWKPSRWPALEPNCHTNTIRCNSVYRSMAPFNTNRRIWAKCCVAIVLWTLRTRWIWPRISIANCFAIKRVSRWHGVHRNRPKSSNAFNTSILCICKFRITHLRVYRLANEFNATGVSIQFSRLVDNLPVSTRKFFPETKEVQFEHGYRLGKVDKDNVYIHNHLKFILSYHMHTK